MKCTVNGNNARTIAKAIQSLAKFSTDLYIEADADALQLRSFNSSKSAMGTFRFKRIFFDSYQISPKGDNYCKIAMKVCLGVFKNMKQVEHCDIQLLVNQAKLQIQFKCRLETIKNALISIVDEENVTTTVTAENAKNRIIGSYKIFNDISNNFNANELEITLEAESHALKVKNYIEGSRVNERFMRSQLKLSPSEFEEYYLQQATTITFCLKEFRAFLAFAESLNENITLKFEEPGDPVFLIIRKNDLIECNLIMSTLYPEDISFDDDLRECEINDSKITPTLTTKKRKHVNCRDNVKQGSTKRRNSETASVTTDTQLFNFNDNNKVPALTETFAPTTSLLPPLLHDMATKNLAHKNKKLLPAEMPENTANGSTLFPITSQNRNTHDLSLHSIENICISQEDENEFIPQSPQSKRKFLRVFGRCFENTYRPKEPSPNSQVFVPDSDVEEI